MTPVGGRISDLMMMFQYRTFAQVLPRFVIWQATCSEVVDFGNGKRLA